MRPPRPPIPPPKKNPRYHIAVMSKGFQMIPMMARNACLSSGYVPDRWKKKFHAIRMTEKSILNLVNPNLVWIIQIQEIFLPRKHQTQRNIFEIFSKSY